MPMADFNDVDEIGVNMSALVGDENNSDSL
jgi:hypothetical protein